MNAKETVAAAFAKANVPLRITSSSLNRNLRLGNRQIVQMAIVKDRGGNESVQMNIPESDDITVKPLGTDPKNQQVLLLVHEPARRVTQTIYDQRKRDFVTETINVPDMKRRFLVGMDECHLFIAQMSNDAKSTSVKQAHSALRPTSVPAGRQAKKQKIIRTGEWFLIPATPNEEQEIKSTIKAYGVHKNVGIGTHLRLSRGRPHVVSESVIVTIGVAKVEFVRGRIVHPDHKVVHLKTWHRVMMNTENRSAGANWVD